MILGSLMPLGLGCLLLALLLLGLSTRRFCQRCDYCGRFYWWIGWAAFEWTSPACQYWAMRCQLCHWLRERLHPIQTDTPRNS